MTRQSVKCRSLSAPHDKCSLHPWKNDARFPFFKNSVGYRNRPASTDRLTHKQVCTHACTLAENLTKQITTLYFPSGVPLLLFIHDLSRWRKEWFSSFSLHSKKTKFTVAKVCAQNKSLSIITVVNSWPYVIPGKQVSACMLNLATWGVTRYFCICKSGTEQVFHLKQRLQPVYWTALSKQDC